MEEINNQHVVTCKNRLCGKEYHESFFECPFCGTKNEQYVPTYKQSKKEYAEGFGRKFIKCVLVILVLIIYMFVVSLIAVGLGIVGGIFHILLLVLTFPLVLNAWHKIVHYGEDGNEKEDQFSDESKE